MILLFILFVVGVDTYLTKARTTDWDRPLIVVVYPINGDGSKAASEYMTALTLEDFTDIERFFTDEAQYYKLPLTKPVEVRLAPVLADKPPRAPQDKSPLTVGWWSLKMRWWSATLESGYQGPPPDIKMYVMYYDAKNATHVDHSLGLEKGLIGVVYAYAQDNLTSKNNVVIAHELLHTVGATDKYDLASGQPIYPEGYAKPNKDPLLPQEYAEIMGGAIPVSRSNSEMPDSLDECLIGPRSAQEINWVDGS
ncbi:MAG: hypothetical protein PVF34_13075 [Gammaproteobacteria bacterium]|jgi:hypothetical protein|nr:hypothetical protein [Gammaproteobacteria bacterium]